MFGTTVSIAVSACILVGCSSSVATPYCSLSKGPVTAQQADTLPDAEWCDDPNAPYVTCHLVGPEQGTPSTLPTTGDGGSKQSSSSNSGSDPIWACGGTSSGGS